MACEISLGRTEPCKTVGGIKAIYIMNWIDGLDYTPDSDDVIDSFGTDAPVTLYKYDLRGNSSFEQNINASRENGTVFFEQVLNLTLKKLSAADHKEIKLLSYGRPHIVVEDYNGIAFLMGKEHGSEVTGGTVVTGAAMGDLSGYTLTFTAMEKLPAQFLDGATDGEPFAGMTSATDTVTAGSDF